MNKAGPEAAGWVGVAEVLNLPVEGGDEERMARTGTELGKMDSLLDAQALCPRSGSCLPVPL